MYDAIHSIASVCVGQIKEQMNHYLQCAWRKLLVILMLYSLLRRLRVQSVAKLCILL